MSGKKGGKKDLNQLQDEYEKNGWKVSPTRNGHLKWYAPGCDRHPYFSSSTPSAPSALANIKSGLARHARLHTAAQCTS